LRRDVRQNLKAAFASDLRLALFWGVLLWICPKEFGNYFPKMEYSLSGEVDPRGAGLSIHFADTRGGCGARARRSAVW
jgi:hypothetical protein